MLQQDKHRQKVREEVTRRGLVSAMNKTKWLEFANAVYQELSFPPAYSRKDVLEKDYIPWKTMFGILVITRDCSLTILSNGLRLNPE
ncbi:hypothetical protein G5Y03_004517 [Vibrio parahaemolyticus]|nr:hypothetical protein [Vibrio parahaemolyticus]